ncbi:DUF6660 family protein [Emticicia fluvialis]|uniref:DUF6660 family protein n=1 Tax=Emticicia fluvialis TaxID=2974474 RepID=UPI002166AD86|nr:DUF6660 family protein [Emticicia fluvialis]
MSRFSNIFFSFYLLFLACMPCHDTAGSADTMAKAVVRSDTDSQAGHGEESDLCSPLCSCACCGNLMISPYTEQAVERNVVSARTMYLTETKDTAGFISLLWQPPQLV